MNTRIHLIVLAVVIAALSTSHAQDPQKLLEQCRENFCWQWENNLESKGYSIKRATAPPYKSEEPTISDNANFACVTVLSWAARKKPWALSTLVHGQRHNPAVQKLYTDTYNAVGDEKFWIAFASATRLPKLDFGAMYGNIVWQKENNAGSVQSAKARTKEYAANKDSYTALQVLQVLLSGQAHNESVMTQYRAAFLYNRDHLFELINR